MIFLEEPEWKMKKFQNIAPKVSEHIHRDQPIQGSIAAPNAGHQNIQRGNNDHSKPRHITKAEQMKMRA